MGKTEVSRADMKRAGSEEERADVEGSTMIARRYSAHSLDKE